MEKQVIIINGRGGVGKDTLCRFASAYYRTRNISSITPIVKIARFAGWDGVKTPASRKLLAQLKEAFTAFNDLPFQYCSQEYEAFLQSTEQILFVHIREPKEIARFQQYVGASCHTLLMRRQALKSPLGNPADDGVENYSYDFYFDNNGPIQGLRDACKSFFAHILSSPETLPIVWSYTHSSLLKNQEENVLEK